MTVVKQLLTSVNLFLKGASVTEWGMQINDQDGNRLLKIGGNAKEIQFSMVVEDKEMTVTIDSLRDILELAQFFAIVNAKINPTRQAR